MRFEQLASDLGDQLCVSAMAVMICVWCWREMNRLFAFAFGLTYVIALVLTTGLKFISGSIGMPPYAAEPFQLSAGAPSGHVALSLVVYGGAGLLFARSIRNWEALAGQILCVMVIVSVAVTRVTLGTHTIADVIAGFLVGGLVLLLPIVLFWSRPTTITGGQGRWLLAGMIIVGMMMLVSGARMPSGDFNLA